MAEEEVLYCSVLTVSDHGRYRYIGILFVFLDEKAHFTPVVDGSRGHLHRGDHFMEPINRPVRFVPELCPPCMADNGGIRIGGGDESGCSRPFWFSENPPLQTPPCPAFFPAPGIVR